MEKTDLFTLKVDSIANFSWTPLLFFQVQGTEREKVKEIKVVKSEISEHYCSWGKINGAGCGPVHVAGALRKSQLRTQEVNRDALCSRIKAAAFICHLSVAHQPQQVGRPRQEVTRSGSKWSGSSGPGRTVQLRPRLPSYYFMV